MIRISEAESDMIRLAADTPVSTPATAFCARASVTILCLAYILPARVQWVAAQICQHAAALRAAFARIEATLRRPPLPLALYALLDCAALYSIAVLVVFDCPSREAGYVAVGVITFLLSYMCAALVHATPHPLCRRTIFLPPF